MSLIVPFPLLYTPLAATEDSVVCVENEQVAQLWQ